MPKSIKTTQIEYRSDPRARWYILGALAVGLSVGILSCWLLLSNQSATGSTVAANNSAIRIDGYEFTQPLILGDHGSGADSPELKDSRNDIQKIIDAAIRDGNLSSASVYFRNLTISQQFSVNGSETYFPASLTKVPLMVSYLKQDELTPGLLKEKVKLSEQSFNNELEVPPSSSPIPGQEYTNDQLIEYMVKYSDNNSYTQLMNGQKSDQLRKLYEDMEVYYPFDQKIASDVITPGQFSLFLRILFNSTYLNPDNSEKALRLLSESEYNHGIAAGTPSNTPVANKFGISTNYNTDGSVLVSRQLHDCGIVYHPKSPYVLCVMTKGNSDLHKAEEMIADISRKVWQDVDSSSQSALNRSLAQSFAK